MPSSQPSEGTRAKSIEEAVQADLDRADREAAAAKPQFEEDPELERLATQLAAVPGGFVAERRRVGAYQARKAIAALNTNDPKGAA